MAQPTFTAYLDWDDSGTFVAGTDDITNRVLAFNWTRGRNADFSGEAIGQASLTLRDTDGYFTNLMDPSGTAALIPGRPLWVYGTYGGTPYGLFYGRVERITADVPSRTVTVEAYDPLRTLSETQVVVPQHFASRTAREMRMTVLEDSLRGSNNLIANPSFTAGTVGWTGGTRITTDGALGGSACFQVSAGTAETSSVLVAALYAGETYQFSAYLKSVSGSTSVTMSVRNGGLTNIEATRTFTITSSWARYSISWTSTATIGSWQSPLFRIAGAGVFNMDAVSLTRGGGLAAYSDTGTGRYSNFVYNGSFEVDTTGWEPPQTNRVTNSSFETNTTGWAGSTASQTLIDGTVTSAYITTGVGRGTSYSSDGSYSLGVSATSGQIRYVAYAFGTAVFKKDATYTVLYDANLTGAQIGWSMLGLSGDYAKATAASQLDNTYSWTPTADSTAVSLYFVADGTAGGSATTFYFDNVRVYEGPGISATTSNPKYGTQCMALAMAGSAYTAQYNFSQEDLGLNIDFSPNFAGSASYIASAWLRSSTGNATAVATLGYNSGGTVDEAKSTATIGTAWTQLTTTWTPSDRRIPQPDGRLRYALTQNDATARTLYVDGVRVIPGTAADDFEHATWNLATGVESSNVYPNTLSQTGNAASVLATLNTVAGSRHWIEPGTASPYYAYTTQDRSTFAALSTAETFNNDFVLLAGQELDRSQIVNVVPVTYGTASDVWYSSDSSSVTKYGPRPAAQIDAGSFLDTVDEAASLGDFVVTQYASPRGRPTLEVVNRFPTILSREVGERIVVTYPALGITSRSYTILRIDGEIRSGGAEWVARYQLEEYPY